MYYAFSYATLESTSSRIHDVHVTVSLQVGSMTQIFIYLFIYFVQAHETQTIIRHIKIKNQSLNTGTRRTSALILDLNHGTQEFVGLKVTLTILLKNLTIITVLTV